MYCINEGNNLQFHKSFLMENAERSLTEHRKSVDFNKPNFLDILPGRAKLAKLYDAKYLGKLVDIDKLHDKILNKSVNSALNRSVNII